MGCKDTRGIPISPEEEMHTLAHIVKMGTLERASEDVRKGLEESLTGYLEPTDAVEFSKPEGGPHIQQVRAPGSLISCGQCSGESVGNPCVSWLRVVHLPVKCQVEEIHFLHKASAVIKEGGRIPLFRKRFREQQKSQPRLFWPLAVMRES